MEALRLKYMVQMKNNRSYKRTVCKVAPNILSNFKAEKPNEKSGPITIKNE